MNIASWRYKTLHPAFLIAWASTGVLVGVGLSLYSPIFNIGFLFIALFLLTIAFSKRKAYMIILVVVAGMFIGLWRGGVEVSQLENVQQFYGQKIRLSGKVVEDVSVGKKRELQLRLKDAKIDNQKMHGQFWVTTQSKLKIKRSDKVVVEGKLKEGFGNFNGSVSFAKIIKAERVKGEDRARDVRDWFAENVRDVIKEPQASLGIGFLTGQRSTLPDNLDEQLRIVGLTHVVVASGYNLTILVRFARRILIKYSKYWATVSASAMISGFVLVTGFSPSMSRAALVTGLSLAAWYYGRRVHPLVLLPFAAAVTVLINPSFLWGDIGWALSFTAFAGVMLLAPLILHYFWGSQKPRGLSQILVETTSAQLATLPIIALMFGQYSLLALPANLLVLPFVPLAMILTFAAGVISIFIPSVSWTGVPAEMLLIYMTKVVDWLANLPGAQGEINFTLATFIFSYMMMILLGVFLWRKTKHNFRQDNIVE